MILQRPVRRLLNHTTHTSLATPAFTQHPIRRALHRESQRTQSIPPPTPFVPDATTFLTLIGRSLSQHASKFQSWSELFNTTTTQLRELGVEPTRSRRYLLHWRDKFRRGEWGVGGDLKHVKDGVGLVGIVELPAPARDAAAEGAVTTISGSQVADATQTRGMATMTRSPFVRRRIVSLPPESEAPPSVESLTSTDRVAFLKIKGVSQIAGPDVELVKGSDGSLARIRVREGLWEHKRGHKVDGGERRKAEVRAKRRSAERRAEAS